MENTETQVTREVNDRQNLVESLLNGDIPQFFGLTEKEIRDLVNSLDYHRGGISPMFLSPGYDDNTTLRPRIVTTILGSNLDTYLHEVKHGLHYMLCRALFERQETSHEAFSLFCETVLGDDEFVREIETRGTEMQKEFIREALELQKKGEDTIEEIQKRAVQFGALTYQHAYFVDPRMCEAAASYKDTGMTRIVGFVNRSFSSLIPYHSTLALKGYGNEKDQSMFKKAPPFHKALLVKRRNYRRDQFFGE